MDSLKIAELIISIVFIVIGSLMLDWLIDTIKKSDSDWLVSNIISILVSFMVIGYLIIAYLYISNTSLLKFLINT